MGTSSNHKSFAGVSRASCSHFGSRWCGPCRGFMRANRAEPKFSMWNRTQERAKASAELLGLEWVEDMRNWNGQPDVIINATSASDQPNQSHFGALPFVGQSSANNGCSIWENSLFWKKPKPYKFLMFCQVKLGSLSSACLYIL